MTDPAKARALANIQPAPNGQPPGGPGRATTHGFYSIAEIERNPRTAAIAAEIEAVLPISAPGDVFAVWMLAGCIERRIRGLAELEGSAKSPKETAVLRRDLSTVENTIGRLLDALGLSPRSRAALGLDIARSEQLVGERLAEHLDRNYGGER